MEHAIAKCLLDNIKECNVFLINCRLINLTVARSCGLWPRLRVAL